MDEQATGPAKRRDLNSHEGGRIDTESEFANYSREAGQKLDRMIHPVAERTS